MLLGGTVIGNGDGVIEDVKSLAEAGKQDITFAVDPYTEYLPQVHAGAVIVEKEVPAGDNTLIVVENPRLAFSQLLVLFPPPPVDYAGHPSDGHRRCQRKAC